MRSFEVHSNESVCRKSGRLEMEQVICIECMHSDPPGVDYIWRHGAADIQMPAPVGNKRKMDN